MSVAKNTAYDVGGQVVTTFLLLLQSAIFMRVFSRNEYGILLFVIQVNVFSSTLINLSMWVSNSYFCGKNPDRLGQLNAISLLLVAVAALIFLCLLTWIGPWVWRQARPPDAPLIPRGYLVLAVSLIPITLYYSAWAGLMVGRGAIRKLTYYNIAYTWIQTFVFILVTVYFNLGVRGVVMAWAILNLCHLAGMLATLATEGPVFGRFGRREALEYLSFCLRAHWGNAANAIMQKIDWFFINRFMGTAGFATYTRAGQIFNYSAMGAGALEQAAYRTIASARTDEAARLIQRMVRNALLLSGLALIVLIPMAKIIVVVWATEKYIGAVLPLRILLLSLPFFCGARMLAMFFTGHLGKPHIPSLLNSLVLPVDLVLIYILARRYGLAGAASATAITWALLFFAFLILFIIKTGRARPGDYLIPKREDFRSFHRYFRQFFGKE